MSLQKPLRFNVTRATMLLLRDALLCLFVVTLSVGLVLLAVETDVAGTVAFPREAGALEAVFGLGCLIARFAWWRIDRRLELAAITSQSC